MNERMNEWRTFISMKYLYIIYLDIKIYTKSSCTWLTKISIPQFFEKFYWIYTCIRN